MRVALAYGQGHLQVELPDERTTVIEPSHTPALPDERVAVFGALNKPTNARPLRDWIKPGNSVCILFTDITRATPNERLIPWLLEYLSDVPREKITLQFDGRRLPGAIIYLTRPGPNLNFRGGSSPERRGRVPKAQDENPPLLTVAIPCAPAGGNLQ